MDLLLYHIKWMSFLGLWPKGRRGFIGSLHTFVFFFLQFLNLISGCIIFIRCKGNLNCMLESTTYIALTVCGLYIALIFLFNEKLYQSAALTLSHLMNEFKTEQYTVEAERFTRKVAIMYTVYYFSGLLQYNIAPLFDYQHCLERDTEDSALICGLPSPGWFPFNCKVSPGLQVAYVIKVIWSTLCVKAISHPIMISSSIIYHIISHLKMIQDSLQKIRDSRSHRSYGALRNIIRHHTAVLAFSDTVSKAFNQFLLTYALLISVVFTLVGFQILQMLLTTIDILNLWRYIMVFGGYFLILLCLSLLGQTLIDESTAISNYAYDIPWYDEAIPFQKAIQLLILRTNKPLELRSAISDVSFPSFGKVMSSTYSYLTMLYNVLLVNEEN